MWSTLAKNELMPYASFIFDLINSADPWTSYLLDFFFPWCLIFTLTQILQISFLDDCNHFLTDFLTSTLANSHSLVDRTRMILLTRGFALLKVSCLSFSLCTFYYVTMRLTSSLPSCLWSISPFQWDLLRAF